MKKILLLFTILFVSVITTACINNFAIQKLNNNAESYMDKGDADAAICRLKASLDLDDEVFQTHYNLAVAYNSIGNYEGALAESQKAFELKPDFYDALYIQAVAKEAIAYQVIDQAENPEDLSVDDIADFNNKASEAVDLFNKYLESNAKASETEQINNKIAELNGKIKEYTDIYDSKTAEQEQEVQEEMNNQEENPEEQPAEEPENTENNESEAAE